MYEIIKANFEWTDKNKFYNEHSNDIDQCNRNKFIFRILFVVVLLRTYPTANHIIFNGKYPVKAKFPAVVDNFYVGQIEKTTSRAICDRLRELDHAHAFYNEDQLLPISDKIALDELAMLTLKEEHLKLSKKRLQYELVAFIFLAEHTKLRLAAGDLDLALKTSPLKRSFHLVAGQETSNIGSSFNFYGTFLLSAVRAGKVTQHPLALTYNHSSDKIYLAGFYYN
uniref:Uncharacterized protein n=1 Tax=Glossina brevipalpis TaxID=37001 RepID=A0A1A9WUG7_9MUSC